MGAGESREGRKRGSKGEAGRVGGGDCLRVGRGMGKKGGGSRRDLEGLPCSPLPTHIPYRLSPEASKVCLWLLPAVDFSPGQQPRPASFRTKGMIPQRLGSTVGLFCFVFFCFEGQSFPGRFCVLFPGLTEAYPRSHPSKPYG